MKTKQILTGVAVLVAGFVAYKLFFSKDEEKSSIKGNDSGTVSVKAVKCKCEGVQNNDGFGNAVPLYSTACCPKANTISRTPASGVFTLNK
jgi:hypothetical protein